MLYLVQSNKMETLLASLLKHLAEQTFEESEGQLDDLTSLLQPDNILVQSPGMSQWLKINIAQTMNIAANIEFPLPSSYIWQLYKDQIKGPKESAFNKSHLTWKILQLLPGFMSQPEFADIRKYLPDAVIPYPTNSKEYLHPGEQLKSFQLAAKIADVYDQYLMYRPDWINAWEEGIDQIEGADVKQQRWQPILWRAIVEFSAKLRESAWHRANMHIALIEHLEQQEPSTSKPLYVFGISAMPVQQLEVLQAIAVKRDVYIFWFNPSHHFWADVVDTRQFKKQQLSLFDEEGQPSIQASTQKNKQKREEALALLDVGNPLLAAWGKPGQDFLSMVSELSIQQDDLFEPPDVKDLLSWVQNEIFELSFRGSRQPLNIADLMTNRGDFPKQVLSEQDRSIEIHATHSKLRELEVLQDQICHWFDTGKVSDPGDIIVMMPDVASYAPVIEAVFSRPLNYADSVTENAELVSSKSIPYAISDQTQVQEDSLVQSFLHLMALEHSRLTLTHIFELIKVPEIAARYQLSIEDIEVLYQWCQKAGIRWGWSGEHKRHWQLPDESQNTWLFGLKRLLSGYSYLSDENSPWDPDILPESEVEGQVTQSLGRFLGFLEDTSTLAEFCRHSHTLEQKITEALLVVDNFYLVDSENEYRVQNLKTSIKKLEVHKHQYTGNISQQVFHTVLLDLLSQSGVGQRFLAGKLNFCTLMPMRSIPFKTVCILGLNDADYPRQTVPVSFDLMNSANYRKGDRSRRLDDRYLFLEAILSARDKLYISYIGRSDRNNEVREPSILVTELLDYCQQSVCFEKAKDLPVEEAEQQVRAHLITWHPLQPWSTDYFKQINARLLSYDQVMFDLSQHALNADKKAIETHKQDPITQQSFLQEQDLSFAETMNSWEFIKLSDTAELPDSIDLESLFQFFRNPVKAWFKNTWKTNFPGLATQSYDQEPLALDALQRYLVTQTMLSEEDTQTVVTSLGKAGTLPVGALKDIELQQLHARVSHLKSKLASVTGSESPELRQQWINCPLQIEHRAGKHTIMITAQLSLTRSGHLVLFRPGKLNANNRLQTWLSWCLYCAALPKSTDSSRPTEAPVLQEIRGWFLAEDKTLCFEVVAPDIAKDYLSKAMNLYLLGQEHCLPIFPSTSFTWADKQDEVKTLNTYQGNDYQMGEGQELHNQRVFPELTQTWRGFTELAEMMFQPVIDFGKLS